jgi:geranylgeranyl pyrophosphate synthase
MDDDDMRRGRPSCHKAFGEARAILAGDGLLILAFETIAEGALDRSIDPERALEAVRRIGRAVGYLGMVGGQAVDMDAQGKAVDGDLVTFLHERKTAALIAASVASGAILGGGGPDRVDALEEYGRHIGLAFQIMDDVLDIEGDPATLGKPVGTDQAHQKATYPAAFGLGAAKQKALDLLTEAQDILKNFGPEADPLRWIAEYLRDRKK